MPAVQLDKGDCGLCGPQKHLCTLGAALAEALHAVQGQILIPGQQGWQGTIKTFAATYAAPIKEACSCQGKML